MALPPSSDAVPIGTLLEAVERHARRDPDHPAVVDEGDRCWTYGALASATATAGRALGRRGIGPGDVVAVASDDQTVLAVLLAVVAGVATATPADRELPATGLSELLVRTEAKVLVVDRSYGAVDRDAVPRGCEVVPADELLGAAADEGAPAEARAEAFRRADATDTAFVFRTSGSTGAAKLVPNSHRLVAATARFDLPGNAADPGRRTLLAGSTSHTLGGRGTALTLFEGGTAIVPARMEPERILAAVDRHRPTLVLAPPPMLQVLARIAPEAGRRLARTLDHIRIGSAPLPRPLEEALAATVPVPVLKTYGMSEAGRIAQTFPDDDAPEGSVGRPVAVELRLEDDEGREVAPGDVGEIVIRGSTVFDGYLDDPQRNAAAFRDGWFRTGDLGHLDEEGFLHLFGRRDEVANRGGQLVALGELERALERHPAVESALVAEIDHPTLAVDLVAAVVAPPGSSPPSAAELRARLAADFPVTALPGRYLALAELPLAASGKPSRPGLARLVAVRQADLTVPSSVPVDQQPRDGTELRLAGLWGEVLGTDGPVRRDDDFFDLGGESLRLLELCTLIGASFGREVTPADLLAHRTLGAMADWLSSSATEAVVRPALVTLRAGDRDLAPLVVVPGAGGTLAALQRFAFRLAPGRRILGIEASGLAPGERPLRRLGRLARQYAGLVRDELDGPFLLAGTSFGAVVAQEMAVRLAAAGRPPDLLVMVDCPAPDRLGAVVAAGRGWPGWRRRVKRRAADEADWLLLRRDGALGLRARIRRCAFAYTTAARRHRPRPWAGPVVMVTSEANRRRTGDGLLGWGPHLTGDLVTVPLPGEHLALLRERGAETAAALDEHLDGHGAGRASSRASVGRSVLGVGVEPTRPRGTRGV